MRHTAIGIVKAAGVASHDVRGQLDAIFRWVRDRVMFLGDVYGVETIQSPQETLSVMAGDCDDRATLLVALARSIGIPADFRFRVIGADRRNPGRFSHVYPVARVGSQEIAMDTTFQHNILGWQYPNPYRRGEVPA